MADEDDGSSVIRRNLFHFLKRFFLESCVADGEDFINQEKFCYEMGGDREGKPNVHSTEITLHRRIEEFFDFREGNDLIEFLFNLDAGHSEYRAIEKNILASGQLRMKACSNFEKRADPAVYVSDATGRRGDSIHDFQQRALACAVGPDDPDHFTLSHVKGNIS